MRVQGRKVVLKGALAANRMRMKRSQHGPRSGGFILMGLTIALFASGCASVASTPKRSAMHEAALVEMRAQSASAESLIDPRKAGDYAVFRISGTSAGEPYTLAERVVARRGAVLVMDYTTRYGIEEETLRVSMDLVAPASSAVFDVRQLRDGAEQPASLAAYDEVASVVARLTPPSDEDAMLDTVDDTIEIGGKPIECSMTRYRVEVDGQPATLTVLDSLEFPWKVVGGEIVTDSSEVIFRADLVEFGESDPSKPIFVATSL